MNFKSFYVVFISMHLTAGFWTARALASQTSVGFVEVQEEHEEQAGKDPADEIIKNKLMRAQTGSLSKYSISTSLGYSAGSIEKPLDASRPNLTGSNQNVLPLVSLGGSVGVRYRLSAISSLTLNGGLNIMTPFNSSYSAPNAESQQQFDQYHGHIDFNNPSLGYTYLFKWGSTQNFMSLSQTYTTNPGQQQVGYFTNTGLSHTIAYEIGTSRWTIELFSYATYYLLNKPTDAVIGTNNGQPVFAGPSQTSYELGFAPTVEYELNDRYNIRTFLGFGFEHVRDVSEWTTLKQDKVYQSVGVGISVTRDIFLYPNIQFIPDNIRADLTNLALQTNINLF